MLLMNLSVMKYVEMVKIWDLLNVMITTLLIMMVVTQTVSKKKATIATEVIMKHTISVTKLVVILMTCTN